MAELCAIVGNSGTGKSTSIRTLNPEETFIISTTGKRPGIKGAKKNRGIYEKVKQGENETARRYKEQHAILPSSSFGLRPIKPITDDELKIEELTEGFSRKDIEKLNESKKRLYEDHERYVEEHKNDPEFVRSEEEISLEEKERLEREKRIEKAKRELAKRNRNK